ncbi:acetyltransferase [Vibrio cidicii]|uniref:Acetyltransferase n=1 Tax=Vibrio cidicii TaxID=1763883 RepID=A0A151JJ66_9VIBR|nr:acetyltransferase [Vibrio cidicii]KYN25712.1 acetyltransferase [Vibrio cidicii]KYN82669.1 acetyltransferase [Vibrio cidicii]
MNYDIFNGDADGIIALLQWRFAHPTASTLITGVKRDIQLLEQVAAKAGDTLTVLDISMEKNRLGLERALASGAEVFYADHHQSGQIPQHASLHAHIDLDADTCTALIIDRLLAGRFHHWAITAAYGDNLIAKANALAEQAGLSPTQQAQLRELGTLINYNGYGEQIDDLHFHPAHLYQHLSRYASPFDVLADMNSAFYQLQSAYQQDMAAAQAIEPLYCCDRVSVTLLPDCAWSRRISGVYGNWLANQEPSRAHAVLTHNQGDSYTVSLRAPLNNKQGAGEICAQFATGGGRAAAAGINALDKNQVERLIELLQAYYDQ